MSSLVGEVYSDALFGLAKEDHALDKCKEELIFILEILEENPKFKKVLINPDIDKKERKSLIDHVFSSSQLYSMNFLKLLVDKSRFMHFNEIASGYMQKYNDEKNIAQGVVYSAQALSDEDMLKIKETLSCRFHKQVELKTILKPDLIGGFQIKLDGKLLDNSIKGRLDNLKSSLKEGKR